MRFMRIFRSLAFIAFLSLSSSLHAETRVKFAGAPGEWLTQSSAFSYNLDNSTIEPIVIRNIAKTEHHGVEFSIVPNGGLSYEHWKLGFDAGTFGVLKKGFYSNATRMPFNNFNGNKNPGISLGGFGKGCNEYFGEFEIIEAIYSQDESSLKSFAAKFAFHCERLDAPLVTGEVYYNYEPVCVDPLSYEKLKADYNKLKLENAALVKESGVQKEKIASLTQKLNVYVANNLALQKSYDSLKTKYTILLEKYNKLLRLRRRA